MHRLLLKNFLILHLLSLSTGAHDIQNLHKLCLNASDYRGCIDSHKLIMNNLYPKLENENARSSNYGPLMIYSGLMRKNGTNLIMPIGNQLNQSLYLALECNQGMLNVTNEDLAWKGWQKASMAFEVKLIDDVCNS